VVSVHVISTREEFLSACAAISQGLGPISIDAERASGFTYSQRAYLIQIYRRNAGTFLFDPPAIGSMSSLMEAVGEQEWILHAASQDLACLREVGINPPLIFDTELSARLLGLERVGLGAVVESLLGIHLAKEHSAVNWSTRPLPEPWLAYAAADVEHLVDLRDALSNMLVAERKDKIAASEFEATRTKPEKIASAHPWRKLSGLHTLRQPKQLAVARELWFARDALARERDISPGRLIPDSAILAAATALPDSSSALIGLKAFNGRDARGSLNRWWNAIYSGLTTEDMPAIRIPTETLPAPRMWRDKNPEGYARLTVARHAVSARALEMKMPVENLLAPTPLRQVAWSPPEPLSVETISAALLKESARAWQIRETAHLVFEGFQDSERKLERILASENETKTSPDQLT
jgi:ribonuclease D